MSGVGRGVEPAAAPPVGLYVHVPFCVSRCPYCDFVVYAGSAARGPRSRIAAFMDALVVELELRADALDAAHGQTRPPLETVYLGGGTPSLVPADEIDRLLARVRDRFGLADGAEISLEANPGPDERGDPARWARLGVNRLSFGAQSMDSGELRRLGRRHQPGDVREAVLEARGAGIGSVNLDLLYDIPTSTLGSWQRTIDAALAVAPDHLSLYALTLDDPVAEGLTGPAGDHLPTTSGARRWRDRAVSAQDDERAAAQYQHAVAVLAEAGLRGYEISNWARPGHEGRHNLGYWQRRPFEAIGPGAHAFDGLTRRWNAARLDAYLAALNAPRPTLPPGGTELLNDATARVEAVILGLRLDTGVALETADGPPLTDVVAWALDAGLFEATSNDRLVLTMRGRLLSNEVFSRLV
ncbi:MAG: coproporphyrinogen-III oxidase family protein [Candidatus Limnocylindrales bacterium]